MTWRWLLFEFSGRLARARYFAGLIVSFTIILPFFLLAMIVTGAGIAPFGAMWWFAVSLMVPFGFMIVALTVKRLHDRDRSGWWLLLFYAVPFGLQTIGFFVPSLQYVLNLAAYAPYLWGAVEIYILRGTVGPNRFGEDPLGPG